MLLILALAILWLVAIGVVVGLCRSAAMGDRDLPRPRRAKPAGRDVFPADERDVVAGWL